MRVMLADHQTSFVTDPRTRLSFPDSLATGGDHVSESMKCEWPVLVRLRAG